MNDWMCGAAAYSMFIYCIVCWEYERLLDCTYWQCTDRPQSAGLEYKPIGFAQQCITKWETGGGNGKNGKFSRFVFKILETDETWHFAPDI